VLDLRGAGDTVVDLQLLVVDAVFIALKNSSQLATVPARVARAASASRNAVIQSTRRPGSSAISSEGSNPR
jgi:hypothetical protein